MSIKTYSELIEIPTYIDRFKYLSLDGMVGAETFGYDRYLNQVLYSSREWQKVRRDVIIRDNGCDLACEGYELSGRILIHHINPMTVKDIVERNPKIFDMNNLITTTHRTHNAIHYGDENLLVLEPIIRTKDDTCPWRKGGAV